MTNYLFNQILSYHNTPLSPLFSSFSPDLRAKIIRSFFDDFEDSAIFLDEFESDTLAALSYIQEHTKNILILSAETGEILMEIPVSTSNIPGAKNIGLYL